MSAPTVSAAPVDSQRMLEATAALPEQVAAAAAMVSDLDLPSIDGVDNIVVLGMGGSGIAGDVLVSVAGPYLPVPVVVLRSYHVPAYVGERSLVIAVSFSGNTVETVEAATTAAVQGARLVVVTRGGELGARAAAWGVPVVPIADGIPQPRAGLGAVSIPPLLVLEELGLFPGASHWVNQAVQQLQTRRDQLMRPDNLAENLARGIGRTLPLIYGGGGLGMVAAMRWKTQLNENAKVPAFWNTIPELCHNEIAGWGQHGDLTRQAMSLVSLRHDFEHPQVMERFGLVHGFISEVVAGIHEVAAEGEGELAQLLDLMMIGDFTSVYAAFQAGIDPGPIPVLDEIKAALGGAPAADGHE